MRQEVRIITTLTGSVSLKVSQSWLLCVYRGMRMHTSLFLICVSLLILYFEFRLWVYQLTNNHSLPPPLESWASAVSHAGVAQQHDWNAHDATVFQRMLIHVWGGTSPRFSHIGRPACCLTRSSDCPHHRCTQIEPGWGINRTWCTQLPHSDNVKQCLSWLDGCLLTQLFCFYTSLCGRIICSIMRSEFSAS